MVAVSYSSVDSGFVPASAVGAEYAGVDLLTGRDGTTYVLEVNGIPGWKGLQEATGIDVAGRLIDYLALPAR